MRERLERFADWRRRLVAELVELPDTLGRIREGSANFELVAQRLADSTRSLEDVTKLYESTMAGTARRSAETADHLRQHLEEMVAESPDRLTGAMHESVREMQRTIESLASLNPLWPKPKN